MAPAPHCNHWLVLYDRASASFTIQHIIKLISTCLFPLLPFGPTTWGYREARKQSAFPCRVSQSPGRNRRRTGQGRGQHRQDDGPCCGEGASLGSDGKESACRRRRLRSDPWVGKIPWRSEWLPTPASLPGEPHGRRSLAGYDRVLGVAESRSGLSTRARRE